MNEDEIRELAHSIIDEVEDQIRRTHPLVELYLKTKDRLSYCGNTLLYGEPYDTLEDQVTAILQRLP